MKLDVNVLRYLSKDDFRVLTAVEMGMRNHEIVPCELIARIASLKHGGSYKVLKNLLKHKLVHHDASKYDGFRLTYLGYDFLAIRTMVNRGVFNGVGRQLGTGKESDIFEVVKEDGTVLAMKLHRLGRVSFRAVKAKRDYLRHRSSYNWLYLSRLAALKEFAFMKVKELQNPDVVFETIIGAVVRLAEHGLIHCDFNEFNIMIDDDEKVTMIDFPQMVSVSHPNAQMYFDRDVECIYKFFEKRFNMLFEENENDSDGLEAVIDEVGRPQFSEINKNSGFLDKELAASGFTRKDQNELEKLTEAELDMYSESDDEGTGDDEDEDEDMKETNIKQLESLQLDKEDNNHLVGDEHDDNHQVGNEHDPEDDGEAESEDDAELVKSLSKQRRKAIQAAHRGKRNFASRNTYKDKGGKSSQSSKVHKQLGGW